MPDDRDLSALKFKIPLIFLVGLFVFSIMFFVPAGTLGYWQGWAYIAVVFIPALFVISYFLKYDPEFLKRKIGRAHV